jgi:hypothetical protein
MWLLLTNEYAECSSFLSENYGLMNIQSRNEYRNTEITLIIILGIIAMLIRLRVKKHCIDVIKYKILFTYFSYTRALRFH